MYLRSCIGTQAHAHIMRGPLVLGAEKCIYWFFDGRGEA